MAGSTCGVEGVKAPPMAAAGVTVADAAGARFAAAVGVFRLDAGGKAEFVAAEEEEVEEEDVELLGPFAGVAAGVVVAVVTPPTAGSC